MYFILSATLSLAQVLDMFGSGVPVCAVSFPALSELVRNGENGIIFRSHSELAAHLYRLFCDSPNEKRSAQELLKMRTNAFNIGQFTSPPPLLMCISVDMCAPM